MPLLDDLKALLDTISIDLPLADSPPGQPISASILNLPSATTLLDKLPIDVDLELTSPINLNFAGTLLSDVLTKNMLFKNASLTDQTFQNVNPSATPPLNKPGLPTVNLLKLPGGNGSNSNILDLGETPISAIEGVPGALGDLQGTLNGPITGTVISALKGAISLPIQVPLAIKVHWSLRTGEDPSSPAVAETDYSFNGDPTLPSISVLLRPETFDLLEGDDLIQPVKRYLHASVTLSAGGFTETKNLKPQALTTISLGIPRILALFANQNFTGPCLVMVPERSTLPDVQTFLDKLAPLQSALEALKSFAEFAAFAAGLGNLINGVIANPHVKFRKQEGIANLNDVVLIQNDPITNDMEAEDELSSLVLIGNHGARVQCYNAREFKTDEGWFEANVRDKLIVMVRNLHEKRPVALPHANGVDVMRDTSGTSFGDTLSSVRFA
ncbi:MAG TPA: hypothetical protein VGD69_15245 [Herpetosiphonaceae bacterium]